MRSFLHASVPEETEEGSFSTEDPSSVCVVRRNPPDTTQCNDPAYLDDCTQTLNYHFNKWACACTCVLFDSSLPKKIVLA